MGRKEIRSENTSFFSKVPNYTTNEIIYDVTVKPFS